MEKIRSTVKAVLLGFYAGLFNRSLYQNLLKSLKSFL